MKQFNDESPSEPSPSQAPITSSLMLPKVRANIGDKSYASLASTPSYRRANASVSSLFASTSTPPGSRPISPSGGQTPSRVLSGSAFSGTPTEDTQQDLNSGRPEDPRSLIVQAFVPHVAVYTSYDTDELATNKGFSNGLWQLLRPFGENIQGKVIIRDSIGASRACEDFAVRFVQLGDGIERAGRPENIGRNSEEHDASQIGSPSSTPQFLRVGGDIAHIEEVVDEHLKYAEGFSRALSDDYISHKDDLTSDSASISPFYVLYLRRLLSGIPLAPHETFSHPVACIIAISSRNPNPIEALRQLYNESSRKFPPWVNSEYLRYYVLVHDEERDEITKSMTLFEQMKRHFGLHCHLLRLRSSQCVRTDDDSVQLPRCEWISAAEELAEIRSREAQEDIEETPHCIFESDVTAIKSFIREMVTQSVVPSMERCVSTWNDQVVSRRKGISGRFMSLSKKWTGFGGGSRTTSPAGAPGVAIGSNSNYDPLGFYRPETPEALMRKLADYAFMLRDWKLAHSVYDMLRADYNNDKAWKYHAAANEMAAISTLLGSQVISSKSRSELVDQMLEAATYSYLTRCGSSYGALRCLTLGLELLRMRGGSATDDAARWGLKILETMKIGSITDALIHERIAACYSLRRGKGSAGWGSRIRKAALWNILAAQIWFESQRYQQAELCLMKVKSLYSAFENRGGLPIVAREFLMNLERQLHSVMTAGNGLVDDDLFIDEVTSVEEESEALDFRSHRKSLSGANTALTSLERVPRQALPADEAASTSRDNDFE